MKFLFVLLSALPSRAARFPLAGCAGALLSDSHGVSIDGQRGPYRLRSGDVIEIRYDDGRVESVVVRVEHKRLLLPRMIEGTEVEVPLDEEGLDRILHVKIVGRCYGRIRQAFFAKIP